MTREHLRILGLVALALFFENFDISLLGHVLKALGEYFDMTKAELGGFTGSIRLGALPAFFLIPIADRIGRRRMFLICIAGMSVGTLMTAFSQTSTQFVLCQVLSRSFIVTAAGVAYVIITEEFPAAHRGWGTGMLGTVASVGFAFGALLFAILGGLPESWRVLYAIGALPLFALPFLRRTITETSRFQQEAAKAAETSRTLIGGTLKPLADLGRYQPRHTLGLIALALLGTAGTAVAFQFTGEFVLSVRGWDRWSYTTMFILCGAVGIVGSPWAGRMGDIYGRRVLAAVLLCCFPFAASLFYLGPSWLIPLSWVLMVVLSVGSSVVIRALTTESFPTARRGTASGLLSLTETLGASLGLFLFSVWMLAIGNQAVVISLISILAVVSALALVLFPETRRRELEEISQDLAS